MRRFLAIPFVALTIIACGGSTDASLLGASDGGAESNARSDAAARDSVADEIHTDAGSSSDAGKKKDATCSPTTDEGDACSVENAFCNPTPCTDACQFCNSLHCESGKWQRMEAFPMPESYCASVKCGSLTCGKGEICVRTTGGPAGAGTTYACAKFPSGCVDCSCAGKEVCSGMQKTCTPDPDTKKPIVDCAAQ